MAVGTRKQRQRQEELWYRRDLAEAAGHPFYRWLNEVLDEAGFNKSCEARCRKFYHEKLGRPSPSPEMYRACNLALMLRKMIGAGTPRALREKV
ncbi:MAG: hypothetical protein ACXVH6_06880 [Halobacteriota archaeon]